jgi:mRNA interferase MazF
MVIERWSIYWADLNPTKGSEQSGRRPVLVISADEVNVLNQVSVIPLTSLKNPQRRIRMNEALLLTAETKLDRDAIALIHQIRTLDKIRLESVAGIVASAATQERIIAALKIQLGL